MWSAAMHARAVEDALEALADVRLVELREAVLSPSRSLGIPGWWKGRRVNEPLGTARSWHRYSLAGIGRGYFGRRPSRRCPIRGECDVAERMACGSEDSDAPD